MLRGLCPILQTRTGLDTPLTLRVCVKLSEQRPSIGLDGRLKRVRRAVAAPSKLWDGFCHLNGPLDVCTPTRGVQRSATSLQTSGPLDVCMASMEAHNEAPGCWHTRTSTLVNIPTP
eukprot:363732-Chlamydomonas_euryale.AAC.13